MLTVLSFIAETAMAQVQKYKELHKVKRKETIFGIARENGITIDITNIDPTVIERLKSQFGDGLTIEIHSYCKKEDGMWEAMRNTKVTTGKPCNLKYQITSAIAAENEDKVVYEYSLPVPTE